jgi:hypothetical protein
MLISIERDNVHADRHDTTELFKHVKHLNPNPLHVQENELSILSNKKLFANTFAHRNQFKIKLHLRKV